MKKLEQICINKLRVIRNIVYSERDYQCRNCESPNYCKDYRPINPHSQILIKKGSLAYQLERR